MERSPCSLAIFRALRTESRIDRSEARHSRLIPATWMMPLNGSRPPRSVRHRPTGLDRDPQFLERGCPSPPLDRPRDALG